MKKIASLFSLIALLAIAVFAYSRDNSAQNSSLGVSNAQVTATPDSLAVKAYYFHYTRRCVTCQSVEKVSADAFKELSGGKIVLKSINLEEKSSDALAKKLGIAGQSLLVVKGTKKVELTKDGFMYAVSSPDKLKEKIKSAVESLK